jgi:hypothetical protein
MRGLETSEAVALASVSVGSTGVASLIGVDFVSSDYSLMLN